MAEIPRKPKRNEPKTGKTFERRVGELFSLLGFSVEADALIAGRQVDLVLEDRSGPLSRQYIVECKDEARPVGVSAYDAFRGRLETARKAGYPRLRGIMATSVGFTLETRALDRERFVHFRIPGRENHPLVPSPLSHRGPRMWGEKPTAAASAYGAGRPPRRGGRIGIRDFVFLAAGDVR